jgi:hypothetical protein
MGNHRPRLSSKNILKPAGLALAAFFLITSLAFPQTSVVIEDVFGRPVNRAGVTLVDWEGPIANPAFRYSITPPGAMRFPVKLKLSAVCPRLYFDQPSFVGADGPVKNITVADPAGKGSFLISIWPDLDGDDENDILTVECSDASGTVMKDFIPIHVMDQDLNIPPPFRVTIDFSKDRTSFFNDFVKRDLVARAAADWAYYIDDMGLDLVPAGAETTWIWNPDGFNSGGYAFNTEPYRGFLLYAYGLDSPLLRSGGEGSYYGGFQSGQGRTLDLRRSGGVEVEIKGNYNTLGWYVSTADEDWWFSQNRGGEPNDLYSIVRHEIGHALFFSGAYPKFAAFRAQGYVDTPELLAYQGAYPKLDSSSHFAGEIDKASQKGAFGNDYHGYAGVGLPLGRWVVSKLDLLCAQAVGYKLRPTSPFAPLSWSLPSFPPGVSGVAYETRLQAVGGLPAYCWTVEDGFLPDGLALDSFSGRVSGAPFGGGVYFFLVRLRDYASKDSGLAAHVSLTIKSREDASLTVLSPAGGDVWEADSKRTVTWTSQGDISAVKIEYTLDGGKSFAVAAHAAPNSGRFEWAVPSVSAEQGYVKISDVAGKAADANDRAFRIIKPLYPPLNVRGLMRENRSLGRREYINELTWDPNPENRYDQKYRIYLIESDKRTLLAEVPKTQTRFLHRRIQQSLAYTYALVTADDENKESGDASVVIRWRGAG